MFYVKGAESYEDLRTVDGELCETFQGACEKRGLLQNDLEWNTCLSEAAETQNASQLRSLFSNILLHCQPANPLTLWEAHKLSLSEDFRFSAGNINQDEILNKTLLELNVLLHQHQKTVTDFGLPATHEDASVGDVYSREVKDAVNYDVQALTDELQQKLPTLNHEQQVAFNEIMCSVYAEDQCNRHIFFLDAPGGTGKTYLLNEVF
jgi:hypothetical protein